MKAQSSVEALAALAALLAALALLMPHAARLSSEFSKSADASGERARVSYEALSLDTAGSVLRDARLQMGRGVQVSGGGFAIGDSRNLSVSEPLFHRVSWSGGAANVVGATYEKA